MGSETNSYVNIVILIITWLITLIIYQKKKKHFDSGSVIILSFLLYSVSSLLLYSNPFWTFNEILLFPFIYLYVMIMISIYPILKYDTFKIKKIQQPSRFFLNTVSLVFILSTLAQAPNIVSYFSDSIINLLTIDTAGQQLYDDAMFDSYGAGSGVSNLAAIISLAFSNIGVFLLFYYITLKNYNKLILSGLLLSCLLLMLSYITTGQRGLIMELLCSIIITFFALKKFFQPKMKKYIRFFAVIILVLSIIPIIALTSSRFGETDGNEALYGGSEASLFYYVGQSNLYFNNYGLDNGGIRYGDRTFPLFKRILGFENIPANFWERRDKYPNLKINDEVFISYVGDFTLDFGPYIAPILFVIFTIFILRLTRVQNGIIKFHRLIIIHFLMCVCFLGGMKLFLFADVGGNLQIIVYVFLFFLFWLDYNRLKIKHKFKLYNH